MLVLPENIKQQLTPLYFSFCFIPLQQAKLYIWHILPFYPLTEFSVAPEIIQSLGGLLVFTLSWIPMICAV